MPLYSENAAINALTVAVDFGDVPTTKAAALVENQGWVTKESNPIGSVALPAGMGIDEFNKLAIQIIIDGIIEGEGFTVILISQIDTTGIFSVSFLGA